MTTTDPSTISQRQQQAADWFRQLQKRIVSALEAASGDLSRDQFTFKNWEKDPDQDRLKGQGCMAYLENGPVFEKAGVNFSEVYGTFSDQFAPEIPGSKESGGSFWASGISLVIHPRSPHVPIVHMNTRMICTSKIWFGGGADLTPIYKDSHTEDTQAFHAALRSCCERHPKAADYPRFKGWCDEYFFLPHRNETRGTGGIFYDYLERNWEEDFAFTCDVGETFLSVYPDIVRRHKDRSWTEDDRKFQLVRRGRYVEFNLLYDRGTRFGLMTGGNTDAILMSLPPLAAWHIEEDR
ncbi:MAG: oxygen-dependent coproporphyrinogen oxidase [Rhodospirillales bacterium]|nr:oxygen-dependent coproporphyrinogen oxidase [Rhodospirillales bacterium]